MDTISKSTQQYVDQGVNVKIKLSALWVTLMLFYIYADILGFYSPGIIESVMSGKIAGIELSEGYLLIMAVWMAIPSLMVVLSLVLQARINRWVNLVVAVLSLVILAFTFIVGEFSIRYTVQALIEAALMMLIIWYAWTWPRRAAGESG
jgi:hypothetical protein